jgi:hypothetical protein
MFKAKEQEAQHQYNKIKNLKLQLDQIKQEIGMKDQRYVKPLTATMFMNRDPSRKVRHSQSNVHLTTSDSPKTS